MGVIVSVLHADRLSYFARRLSSVLAVMVAALAFQSSVIAQTLAPDPAKASPATEAQATPAGADEAATVAPVQPEAISSQIPTASQIEAAGRRDTSEDPVAKESSLPPTPTVLPAAVKSESPSPVSPEGRAAPLPAKYDVSQIGQRNVGSGLDFYSLDREVALGRQLSQELEQQARLVTDPVITEFINRIGQNLGTQFRCARAVHHQGPRQ